MVRTKADGGARKAVAAKAPRKSLGGVGGAGSGSAILSPKAAGKNKYAGGNVVCDRPTPEWQKGIMNFLIQTSKPKKIDKENDNPEDDAGAGTSTNRDTEICEEIKEQTEAVETEEVENNEEMMDKDDGKDKTNISESSSSHFKKNNCIDDSDDDE
ncbi:PCNA-associated factor-like [Anneissia japonica]|uniref:PCNA-associated factor-like n=1 Tax=Anneissia japonica TaxID=1529436 RepID=UPI0014255B6D|nr:PCNA-associated factor-like [Anneissia japonica]